MKTSSLTSPADKAFGDEKRRIFGELRAFRKKYGVGCFRELSDATGGKIAIHTISQMYMGTKVSNDIWLQVGEALEKLRKG
jgi:hypothetical protein